jgi:uncharacterized DUF497 family protein
VIISGFDWDDDNVFQIGRHAFTPEEVEEVFAGSFQIRRARQKRYIALGETLDGRLTSVVFLRMARGVIRVHGSGHGRQGAAALPPQIGGRNEKKASFRKGATS